MESTGHDDMIQQFHDLTGIDDLLNCKTILENHGWNLELAINTVFNETDIPQEFQPIPIHSSILNDQSSANRLLNEIASNSNNSIIRHQQSSSFLNLIYNLFHLTTPMTPNSINRSGWRSWACNLLTFPIRIVYYSIVTFLQFFTSMLQFNALKESHHPEVEVAKFISDFESEYGASHPTFYLSSYGKALNDAKARIKFLLVYLHDPGYPDTKTFCETILCSPPFINFIDNQSGDHYGSHVHQASTSLSTPSVGWMMWACNVNTSEGRKVARALSLYTNRRLSTNETGLFPFLAVLGLKMSPFVDGDGNWLPFYAGQDFGAQEQIRPRMTILARFKGLEAVVGSRDAAQRLRISGGRVVNDQRHKGGETSNGDLRTRSEDGLTSVQEQGVQYFLQRLRNLASSNKQGSQIAMEEKMAREHTKTLRQQQDEAYTESLKADKVKIEQKRLDRQKERRSVLESEFKKRKGILTTEALYNLKIDLANRIAPEPTVNGLVHSKPTNIVKTIIKLPKGKRLERSFLLDSPLQDLFYYVFCHPDSPPNFTLATHYPRKQLPCHLDSCYKANMQNKIRDALCSENEEFRLLFSEANDEVPPRLSENGPSLLSPDHNHPDVTFRDFGIEHTTVLYVQDIEDDDD